MWKSSHPLASLQPKQPNKLHSLNLESKQSQVICGFPLTLPGTSPPFFKYRHQAVSSFKRTVTSHIPAPTCSPELQGSFLSHSSIMSSLSHDFTHEDPMDSLSLCSQMGSHKLQTEPEFFVPNYTHSSATHNSMGLVLLPHCAV